jgi:ribose transport system permease protein
MSQSTRTPAQPEPSDTVASVIGATSDTWRERLSGLTQAAGLVTVIAAVAVFFQVKNPTFLHFTNVVEVLRSGVLYFIVAAASTLVMVGGGLDLSVGSIYAAGGIVAAEFMTGGMPWPFALALGVVAGGGLGALNALMTNYLKVPPLIATLGTFFVVGGVVTVVTGGNDIFSGIPASFNAIGQNSVFGVPNLVIYGVIIGIGFHVVLERTSLGYNIKATGGNRAAASANGIRVTRVDLILYAASGAATAFAGILFAARTGAASPQAGGYGLTFEVLTAVIIGGTSLFGGIGTVFGSALGCLLFAETENGLAVVNINPLYQQIIIGVILVFAVTIDQARRRRQFRIR